MKRFIITIPLLICLLLCSGCDTQAEPVGQETAAPSFSVSLSQNHDSAQEANELEKLLALAGDDDLLLVYYDPTPEIVSLSGAQRFDLMDGGPGNEILLVNVSDVNIEVRFNEYSESIYIGSYCWWEHILAPNEAVLIHALYSEGIPSHAVFIFELDVITGETVYAAEHQLTYDGSGTRGPVFVKWGDTHDMGPLFYPDKLVYFTLDVDEYNYLLFVPDGTGLWGQGGDVVLIDWDRNIINYHDENHPYVSEGNVLLVYPPDEDSADGYVSKFTLQDGAVPKSVFDMYVLLMPTGIGMTPTRELWGEAAGQPDTGDDEALSPKAFTQPDFDAGEFVNTNEMTDTDLAVYLLESVPDAYERVFAMRGALTPLATGETVELTDYGVCRLVWLGDEFDGRFDIVITYAITSNGMVFEYNPDDDLWHMVSAVG